MDQNWSELKKKALNVFNPLSTGPLSERSLFHLPKF